MATGSSRYRSERSDDGGGAAVIDIERSAARALRPPDHSKRRLGEEQDEGDDEAEDAETFRERRADERAGELAVGRRRVAQGAREEVAEDVADAHGGEAHADAGEAGAEELESSRIHRDLLEVSDREGREDERAPDLVARVQRVVEVDAGQDREDVGLQEGDEELERHERDRHEERQRSEDRQRRRRRRAG